MLIALLAQTPSSDAWITGIISGVGGSGFGIVIAWYLLTRTVPKQEETHGKQLLEQRADLLNLCQKERELAERVVAIFADAQQITVKDNHEAIITLHGKADEFRTAAYEVLKQLREDTTLRDEYIRTRAKLDELERKYGSDNSRRRSKENPPT